MQRRVPKLKHQPLLWIHGSHLRGRDAKRARIELLHAANEAAVAHAVRTLGLGSYSSSSSDDGHGGFKGDPGVVSVELDVERLQSGLGVLADLCPNLKSLSLNVNQVGCES